MRNKLGLLLVCLQLGCGGKMAIKASETPEMMTRNSTVVSSHDAASAQVSSGKAKIYFLARGENAFVGQLWIAPKAGVPLHRDPTEEYLIVLEGGGVLTMDGVDHILSKGSAVFMPARAEVKFRNGDAPTVVIQVFAGPESADKYQNWERISKGRFQ